METFHLLQTINASFYKQDFYTQHQAVKFAKNQEKAKQDPEAEQFLFENYSLSSPTLLSKNNRKYSRKCTKNYSKYLQKMVL